MNANESVFVAATVQGAVAGEPVSLLVKVFAPVEEGGRARCKFEIWLKDALQRQSSAVGDSEIHALMLALWKIETDLVHMSPFKEMNLEVDDHVGIGFIHSKKVWESVYGQSSD